jgi:hypothetical protein
MSSRHPDNAPVRSPVHLWKMVQRLETRLLKTGDAIQSLWGGAPAHPEFIDFDVRARLVELHLARHYARETHLDLRARISETSSNIRKSQSPKSGPDTGDR